MLQVQTFLALFTYIAIVTKHHELSFVQLLNPMMLKVHQGHFTPYDRLKVHQGHFTSYDRLKVHHGNFTPYDRLKVQQGNFTPYDRLF